MEDLDKATRRKPLMKCKSLEKVDMSTSFYSTYSDEFLSRTPGISLHITAPMAECRDEMDAEISQLKANYPTISGS